MEISSSLRAFRMFFSPFSVLAASRRLNPWLSAPQQRSLTYIFRTFPFRQSSVYCFYDPAYRALALGKLTALKETEFVREVRFTFVPMQ